MVKRCCIRFLFTYYIKKFISVILSFCISQSFILVLDGKFQTEYALISVKLMKRETLNAFSRTNCFIKSIIIQFTKINIFLLVLQKDKMCKNQRF